MNGATGKLRRQAADGSMVALATDLGYPRGVALDVDAGKVTARNSSPIVHDVTRTFQSMSTRYRVYNARRLMYSVCMRAFYALCGVHEGDLCGMMTALATSLGYLRGLALDLDAGKVTARDSRVLRQLKAGETACQTLFWTTTAIHAHTGVRPLFHAKVLRQRLKNT